MIGLVATARWARYNYEPLFGVRIEQGQGVPVPSHGWYLRKVAPPNCEAVASLVGGNGLPPTAPRPV
jgi:hypothetical protein